jgi:hypothetical protein
MSHNVKPTNHLKPIASEHSAFWQNAHTYFDRVYSTMGLDQLWRPTLASPKRVLAVSCSVRMDDGRIQVFTGYRCQHNNARGPFKGGMVLGFESGASAGVGCPGRGR